VKILDEIKLRNAINSSIQGDLQMNLSHSGQFQPHVLEALERSLLMSITKAIIEYDKIKSEEK